MFKNYFPAGHFVKTTIRNLLINKAFSFIHITGLSIGLACCMLILLFIKDELSFDRFHEKYDRIYQLTCDRIEKEGIHEKFAIAAMVQGPAFKQEIPEIQEFVRVYSKQLVVKKDNTVFSENVTWVDENFFSVFSFPLLAGDPKKVLSDLHSIILTRETAKKYFSSPDDRSARDAIGKILQLEINGQFESFRVSGIAENAPKNSSIRFNVLLPFRYLEQTNPDNGWMWVSYPTYFSLQHHANLTAIAAKMAGIYQTQAKSEIDMNHLAGYDNTFVWGLMPFVQMHLNTEYEGVPEASNPIYSYMLTGIAIFILLIACINFVNLTLARSLKRSKEIGIRKVIGGLRSQLILQFLGESLVVCMISFLLAILLAVLALPVFNIVSNKSLSLGYLFDLRLVMSLIVLFLFTGFVAGSYPAFALSGFNPVKALYNRTKYGRKNFLAKSLVVLQFSLSTFLIIATFFVYAQFNYLTKSDLGYHDKNLVEFTAEKAIMNKPLMDVLKTACLKVPGVQGVAYRNIGKFGGKTRAGGKEFAAIYENVDEDYLTVLEASVLEGRNFSRAFPSDAVNSILINETYVREAGWKDPIGKVVDFMNLPGWGERKITVIGVVKDYHFESMKEKIKPQVFIMEPQLPLGRFLIRISPGNIPATIRALENGYHTLMPDQPFQYSFKEDLNRRNYEAESKWKLIITLSALLTIFISSMGLFGLSMLTAERRAKEMSIRKVLGASTMEVVQLVSINFVKLVFIAFIIAIPIGWYAVNRWLQSFAYRITISWWMFGLAGILTLLIALFTVSFHAIKTSAANPVNALRSE